MHTRIFIYKSFSINCFNNEKECGAHIYIVFAKILYFDHYSQDETWKKSNNKKINFTIHWNFERKNEMHCKLQKIDIFFIFIEFCLIYECIWFNPNDWNFPDNWIFKSLHFFLCSEYYVVCSRMLVKCKTLH